MGTKRDLVHEMRCQGCFGASFAALLHTLAQLPGVEPHATLVASPGSCCASTSLDLLGARCDVIPSSVVSHAKLLYTSPWPSGGLVGLDLIEFCVSRPFY